MSKTKRLFYALVATIVCLVSACNDDLGIDAGRFSEGEALISVRVRFDQDQVSLGTRATGGDRGDIIQDMDPLYMVVYRKDGTLYGLYPVWGDGIIKHDDIDNVKHELADNRLDEEKGTAGNAGLQDSRTGKVSFDLKLRSGKYYIYAVANVPDLRSKDITTRDKLKNLSFTWDETTTENNSQMFGIFTELPNRSANDNAPLSISATTTQLHCWARRLASKVTVAFDGTDLYDNVQVYITDIAIRDIPKTCTLGLPNTPGGEDRDSKDPVVRKSRYDRADGVIETGKNIHVQTIEKVHTRDNKLILPENYLHVCNDKHPYLGIGEDGGSIENAHAHDALSLFFYENMQGTGKPKEQSQTGDKIDFPDPDIDTPDSGWKDEKPFGTYVEVTGYYRCISANSQVGSGIIKYRYMLGQKPEKDGPDNNYDVKRNTHYKLTLKFKGYGNDADWHIDYEEKPGIYITSPQYISYLYNKKMMTTVKIVGKLVGTMTADIIQDDSETYWRPWGDDSEAFHRPPKGYYWNTTGGKDLWPVINHAAVTSDGPWNSFLSLRQTQVVTVKDTKTNDKDAASGVAFNQTYYTDNHRGDRSYSSDASVDNAEKDGKYTVESSPGAQTKNTEHIFFIPLYTRAKVLCIRTGYTGNNPYVGYPRKARVRFTATVQDPETGETEKQEHILDIIQVRRIVNPKGVWRKAGSQKTFHVELLHLPEDDDTSDFVSFKSEGGWSAEVAEGGDDIISLTSTKEGSGEDNAEQTGVKHIEGVSEHPIKFDINFKGRQSGFAVVRVRYHNYTCEHDIFCSVGDEAVQLRDDKNVWWHSRNVYRFNSDDSPVYANSPLDAGSLFRRGNRTAILDENDQRSGTGPEEQPTAETLFKVLKPGETISSDATWDACSPNNDAWGQRRYREWTIPENTYGERLATIEDYFALLPNTEAGDDEMTFEIKQAYGVLYGEGADQPQTTQDGAYRNWHDYDVEKGGASDRGMRGCFVYNQYTMKYIFLPIGAEGFGHRKHSGGWRNSDKSGTLRYSSRSTYFSDTDAGLIPNQPLFYDLFKRPGAIYWCKDWRGGGTSKNSSAFDINYFTFGFSGYDNSAARNVDGQASTPNYTVPDACYIRTVYTKNPN